MHTELMEAHLLYPESPTPRTPGIHQSTVLRRIAQENGVLQRELRHEELGLADLVEGGADSWWASLPQDVRLKICMGLAWEAWYIPQLTDVVDHPGEYEVQGIYMTPDGESLDVVLTPAGEQYEKVVHEVKLTYKSTNTIGNLSTQWLWIAQCKGYCKALGTLTCYLHVLAVCGDYSRPIKPMLKIFKLTFTQAEIDEGWDVIISFVNYYRHLDNEDTLKDTI